MFLRAAGCGLILPALYFCADRVEFNRDIQPSFSDKCFACHGPDAGNRKPKMRLDQESGAKIELRGGRVSIVSGDAAKSEVYRRVSSDNKSGGPSQIELFDYKPKLKDVAGKGLPDSVRSGQRLTGMSASQSSFPMVPSKFAFAQHGESCTWGITLGETDEYCYNVVKDPVHVHDLHATILNRLGVDHTRLTYPFQGRHFRPTEVSGSVVKPILA